MGRRKSRKKKRRKKIRLKKSPVFRFIRGVFAIVILSGFFVGLFLFIKEASTLFSSGSLADLDEVISVEPVESNASGEGNSPAGFPKKALGEMGEVKFQIGLLADSENDNESLKRAVTGLEDFDVQTAFFLGDLTRYGGTEELRDVKRILDSSEVDFIVIPGDHDLAESVDLGDSAGRKNFVEIFGETNHLYEKGGQKFMLFDNSANFTKISEEDFEWFKDYIDKVDFVVLSQPLYHPTSDRVMGKFEGEVVSTVRFQAEEMLKEIRDSKVKAIIAADQHFHSINIDPERESLAHIVVGALVSNRESLRNPQSSRYAILKVYENGSYSVDEVVL